MDIGRVLMAFLIHHADATGRVHMPLEAVVEGCGGESPSTIRRALESLARDGWLVFELGTWPPQVGVVPGFVIPGG